VYQVLAEELEQRGRQRPLNASELAILRRALFGVADLRFDLNEFNEALRLYQALQQRYPRQVEGLIACQRIWLCVGVIVQPPEQAREVREAVKLAVRAAQSDLEVMDENSELFRGPGVWTKQDWQNWLTWVNGKLNEATQPPPRVNPLAN
jgi:hypothetical protein